MDIW